MTTPTTTDNGHGATMTVEQAAELIGISRRSAYRAVEAGHLPVLRIGRRILVITARLYELLGLSAVSAGDASVSVLSDGRTRLDDVAAG